jgi:hypothetical protein
MSQAKEVSWDSTRCGISVNGAWYLEKYFFGRDVVEIGMELND